MLNLAAGGVVVNLPCISTVTWSICKVYESSVSIASTLHLRLPRPEFPSGRRAEPRPEAFGSLKRSRGSLPEQLRAPPAWLIPGTNETGAERVCHR